MVLIMNMVFKRSLAAFLINISAGLVLTLMTTTNYSTLLVNIVFVIISFKLAVDIETYGRSNRKS